MDTSLRGAKATKQSRIVARLWIASLTLAMTNEYAAISVVMPAKAGIQYAAASQFEHRCLWNNGSSGQAGR
jgi:hypothetical protein